MCDEVAPLERKRNLDKRALNGELLAPTPARHQVLYTVNTVDFLVIDQHLVASVAISVVN